MHQACCQCTQPGPSKGLSANWSLKLKKSVVMSQEHLFSNKVTINLCVWFFHGRPGLMQCEV